LAFAFGAVAGAAAGAAGAVAAAAARGAGATAVATAGAAAGLLARAGADDSACRGAPIVARHFTTAPASSAAGRA
jgi:hypothetical protein